MGIYFLGAGNDAKHLQAFLLTGIEGAEVVRVASAASVDELLARLGQGVVEKARHVRIAGSGIDRVGALFRWRQGPERNFDGTNDRRRVLLQGCPARVLALLESHEVVAIAPASAVDELLASLGHVVEVIAREEAATGSGKLGLVAHRVPSHDFPGEDWVGTNDVL